MMRKAASRAFTVTAVKDAITYEVRSSVGSVVIPADTTSVSFSLTGTFYRRVGQDTPAACSCYATAYFRRGSTFVRITSVSTSSTISVSGTASTSDDAIVIFMFSSRYIGTLPLSQNYLAKLEIPVLKNGDTGSKGQQGRMFYLAGRWSSGNTYTRTIDACPIVEHDGSYWYLDVDSSIGDTPNNNSTVWKKAENFGVVLTEALFAEFGKFGSAVISGDRMFSMNGRIDSTEYNDGAVYLWDRPAYMWFVGDTEFTLADYGLQKGVSSNRFMNVGQEILMKPQSIMQGSATLSRVVSEASTSDRLYLKLYDVTNGTYLNYSANGTTVSEFRLTTNKQVVSLSFTSSSTSDRKVRWRVVNSYSSPRTLNIGLYVSLAKTFEPNWWVDLRTGKMVAACGNFVVFRDGRVSVANDKFTVDSDGNVVANDITIKGSLMCHDVLFAYSSVSQPKYKVYTAHYDEESAFKKMSLDADTIIVNGVYYSAGVNVELPPAMFFPGVRIKIMNATYETVNSQRKPKKCSITISVAHNGDWKEDAWNTSLESLAVAVPFKTSPDASVLLPFDYRTDVTYTTYSMVELVSTRNIYNSQTSDYYVWMIVDVNE